MTTCSPAQSASPEQVSLLLLCDRLQGCLLRLFPPNVRQRRVRVKLSILLPPKSRDETQAKADGSQPDALPRDHTYHRTAPRPHGHPHANLVSPIASSTEKTKLGRPRNRGTPIESDVASRPKLRAAPRARLRPSPSGIRSPRFVPSGNAHTTPCRSDHDRSR